MNINERVAENVNQSHSDTNPKRASSPANRRNSQQELGRGSTRVSSDDSNQNDGETSSEGENTRESDSSEDFRRNRNRRRRPAMQSVNVYKRRKTGGLFYFQRLTSFFHF